MNVIFLDFDGVIYTIHYHSNEDIEKRIIILSDICKTYNCKVVISSSSKDGIDEETGEIYNKYVRFVFDLFNKYDIECIGRTPTVIRRISKVSYIPVWKEDEIRLYLFRHPEIKHYCIIDDDDFKDLEKLKDHLVKTIFYAKNPEEEGLLEKHKEEVGKILNKDNEIRKLVLKRKKNQLT